MELWNGRTFADRMLGKKSRSEFQCGDQSTWVDLLNCQAGCLWHGCCLEYYAHSVDARNIKISTTQGEQLSLLCDNQLNPKPWFPKHAKKIQQIGSCQPSDFDPDTLRAFQVPNIAV